MAHDPQSTNEASAEALRRVNEELAATNQQLRDKVDAMIEFLAMLGHELRNPLTAVKAAADLLEVRAHDPASVERVHAIIERQSGHMAKLLDGLLDVSRIIRGKIVLERDVVDVTQICRDVMADLSQRITSRSLDLRMTLSPEPVWVEGDSARLIQILDNLLTNAIKFTPDGGTIRLSASEHDGMALLTVYDTGAGIEPELLPHVFDVFRTAKHSLDRASGGLGLGLELVKSLVALHGGDVEAFSDGRETGARFVVRLPITLRSSRDTPK